MSYTIDNTDLASLEGDFHVLDWEDKPTKSGYYWVKDKGGDMQIVWVYEAVGEFRAWSCGFDYDCAVSVFVSWLGPIPEPIE